MKRPFAELWGTGSYAPPRVMTNDEFSKFLDTSDQWIQERTGIRERRVSSKEETNACMGKKAALQVLEETGLTPLDIDAIQGGVPVHIKAGDTTTPLGDLRPPKSP